MKIRRTPRITKAWITLVLTIGLGLLPLLAIAASKAALNEKFMKAAWARNVEEVEILLDKGADINARDRDRRTPLMDAARMGFTEIAKLLLERGADVNVRNRSGDTALSEAASNGRGDVARLKRGQVCS